MQAEKREQDLKAQLERAFVEAADHKVRTLHTNTLALLTPKHQHTNFCLSLQKSSVVLAQQLAATKKEAENAKFQLREQASIRFPQLRSLN